jgi:antitoxin HicB
MPARHHIALIHQSATCFGVSFPDLPGITTAADTLDEALARAGEVLAFAFEDCTPPAPRGLEELRLDAEFVEWSAGAVAAEVWGQLVLLPTWAGRGESRRKWGIESGVLKNNIVQYQLLIIFLEHIPSAIRHFPSYSPRCLTGTRLMTD